MGVLSYMPLFIGNLRGWQFIIVILVILLLFGGKKIPEMMRGLGKGVASFRQGLDEAKKEMNKTVGSDEDTKEN
jgi:twin arginine-targeting protein translocase, tatA/E family